MKLIIVESPTKAKTITKFLGRGFKIESSFGHIRDLPKSTLGVDTENNYEPKYLIPAKARKNLNKLKELAKKADEIILATDEDREGEAIAWHLQEALKLDPKTTERIVFHEITKDAIFEALKNPRSLDMNQVDAQQARRVLDRLVGYELSPFLWKKVARGLSAGRVQSVAVRLVVEREREITAFKPEEYWSLELDLAKKSDKEKIIRARLNKIDDQVVGKLDINNKAAADKISNDLEGAQYIVSSVIKKQNKKNPPNPFTTSTLQQTANRMLGYSAKRTMIIAQQLYEQGFITYMRTDSLNLADKFLTDAHKYLRNNVGDKYALSTPRKFKTKSKGAQEAHEAIRPTEAENSPENLGDKISDSQKRLYTLIWQRAIASQMPEAVMDATTLDIDATGTAYQFRATGQVINFPGYLKIYPEKSKELELPLVEKGEQLDLVQLDKEEHFTKPPARYSDAGLVKELEKYGIGRPSTYAPTLATIETRNYVTRDEGKKLAPTDIAFVVNDLLVEHFPQTIDFQFTAKMENDLDKIAEGEIAWQPIIRDFYVPFHKNLEEKYNTIKKETIMPEETTTVKCDKCGAPMLVKTGRFGKFLACSAFPACKNIKSMPAEGEDTAEKDKEFAKLVEKYKEELCEKCGEKMALKNGRFGPFLACTGYPNCKNIRSIKENVNTTGIKCPLCGKGEIVQKKSKRGIFYACNQYPDCKNAYWGKPTGEKCPTCGALMIETKEGEKCSAKGCGYEK
ncbi:MAG: type I DNA topoisomerase [Candidatus Magasanikbacteria bacterium]|nr:type I DNA topoisomerase [Candidatus Magasanikbacteria bacterium]